jgi:hypothetical protein
VEPVAACGEDAPADVWPLDIRAGTVIVDARRTPPALTVLAPYVPGEEMWYVDGHVVLRRWPASMRDQQGAPEGNGEIELLTPTGARHRLSGFPEHVIDDGHAIVRADPTQHVVDTRTGKIALDVRPARKAPTSVAGTVFVPDASSPIGAAAIGALDFAGETWTAFVLDARGKTLAQLEGPTSDVAQPVATRDGAIVLAAWRAPELEVVRVRGGRAMTRKVTLQGIAHRSSRDAFVVAAAGDTMAVGLGAQLVVLRGEGAPIVVDTEDRADMSRSVAPLTVLAGGNVVVASARGRRAGTLVVDARDGHPIAWTRDEERRITDRAESAVVLDPDAKDGQYVIVVGADGAVTRGTIGEARVGRFTLRTYAGIVDPARACSARTLSQLPPLLRYGDDAVLPADLVE